MKYFLFLIMFSTTVFLARPNAEAAQSSMESMGMGIPMDMDDDVNSNFDICPQGARVIAAFLNAWANNDYQRMYELLDDDSKKDYSFDEARLDFETIPFKMYNVSSVRKDGENFVFILSYGDWQSGDKDIKKMFINGRTFKIIMPTKNSPFKDSVERYF